MFKFKHDQISVSFVFATTSKSNNVQMVFALNVILSYSPKIKPALI